MRNGSIKNERISSFQFPINSKNVSKRKSIASPSIASSDFSSGNNNSIFSHKEKTVYGEENLFSFLNSIRYHSNLPNIILVFIHIYWQIVSFSLGKFIIF
jgi:hypothetical protein